MLRGGQQWQFIFRPRKHWRQGPGQFRPNGVVLCPCYRWRPHTASCPVRHLHDNAPAPSVSVGGKKFAAARGRTCRLGSGGGGGHLRGFFFSRLITSTFPLPPSLFGIKMCVQWHVKFGYGNHVITSLNPIGSSPDTPAALIGRFVLTTGVIMNESSRLIGLSQVNFMSISTGNQNIDRKFGHF